MRIIRKFIILSIAVLPIFAFTLIFTNTAVAQSHQETVTCPICGHEFEVTVIDQVQHQGMNTDFSTRYRSDNIYQNSVHVCPVCNYAAWSADFSANLTISQKARISDRLARVRHIYGSYYEIPVYDRFAYAALTYEVLEMNHVDLAYLYLTASWACRETGDIQHERAFQQVTIREMTAALEQGSFDVEYNGMESGSMEVMITYLIGELYRRTGQFSNARVWLSDALELAQERDVRSIEDLAAQMLEAIDAVATNNE